jgi:phage terminase large subunit-like protein
MTKRTKPYIDEARAERVQRFFGGYLKHTRGRWAGQPFLLEDWQYNDIIRPIFGTVDPKTDKRFYKEALIGLSRKNAKSEKASGMSLYGLLADGEFGAEVYTLAGSRQQASIVFKTAADMVRASPMLRAACKVYRSVIEVPETGAIYRALSADADLQHGLNPHMAIVDEYHVHKNSEQYEAMRSGTAARDQSLLITISTAGAERRGPLWELLERGRSGADPRLYTYWRQAAENADLRDRKAWRDANPASWVSDDFLEQQLAALPEAVFRRLHLNQWWEGGMGAWVPRESYELCFGDPSIDPNLPAVIAVDAASRHDTTAVAIVQRTPDGMYHGKVWHFEADNALGYFDYTQVEDLIRELCGSFFITRVAFDPFQMVRTQQLLLADGIPAETFPQNDARMVPASQLLYDIIMEGNLTVDRNDDLLHEQMMAAGIYETARGWRLHKRKSTRTIDSAIALAMGVQLATWEADNDGGPRIFTI